jgi:Cdc6-like AAA superfamily ATPase
MKLNQLRQIIREELKEVDSSDRVFPSYNQILAKGVEGGGTQPKSYFNNKENMKDMVDRITRHIANDSKADAERDLKMLKRMIEKLPRG